MSAFNFEPIKTCCIYSATEPSGHCEKKVHGKGRCASHYKDLLRLAPEAQAEEMERNGKPARPSWTHEGDEDFLAEHFGKNDELKSETTGAENV
jgi:hypothetical protein